MKIYLDIDEIILRNDVVMMDKGGVFLRQPAAKLKEFLEHFQKSTY